MTRADCKVNTKNSKYVQLLLSPEELNEITLEALVVSLVCCINKQADGVLDAHALLLKVFEKADGMLHSLTRNALSDEDIEKLSEVIFNEEP